MALFYNNSILVVRSLFLLVVFKYSGADSSEGLTKSDPNGIMAGSGVAKQLFACNFEVFGKVQGILRGNLLSIRSD